MEYSPKNSVRSDVRNPGKTDPHRLCSHLLVAADDLHKEWTFSRVLAATTRRASWASRTGLEVCRFFPQSDLCRRHGFGGSRADLHTLLLSPRPMTCSLWATTRCHMRTVILFEVGLLAVGDVGRRAALQRECGTPMYLHRGLNF